MRYKPRVSRRAPQLRMRSAAGGSEGQAPLSRAEFEQAKLRYVEAITQELEEAAGLMEQLNRNLGVWARRAGQPEALAQVWSRFQARLGAVDPPGRSLAPPPPRAPQ